MNTKAAKTDLSRHEAGLGIFQSIVNLVTYLDSLSNGGGQSC